ncbi:extracellular solute-binding protein [Candidatus Pelagibacter sp.]|jgi:iron(III) transport system substrate-binding protein|nr:extracellular solute-binding protein [Candidatus Pelagibacter sp.]
MKKITIIAFFLALFANITIAAEVNVFSARHYDSDIQLYEKFTAKTGIKVNIVSGKDKALQKRITEEGADSKADLYITADAGRLGAFADKGMFQNSMSPAIKAAVPANFRTSKWTGIAKRARIIYFSPERVSGAELLGLSYEGLADPKWKGRVVIRKSNNVYNQSLVASLIKNNGKKATAEWAKGVVSNMSRDSKGNDRAQILAVAAGEADIAVANTYYLALMLSGKKGAEQQAAAKKVKPFFPNQENRGTHMNISGGGVLKYAPNKANAIKLLEFLLTKEAQEHIVNNTFEYPMIAGVSPHPLVIEMGLDFKQDLKTKVANYGKRQADALEVMLAAKWK